MSAPFMEKSYTVTKNVIFNFAGQFFLLLISFLTTPIIIGFLGNDLFGILAIVTAVLGYFSLLDLGMGLSVIKYISEYSAKDDKRGIEKIVGSALTVYTIIGLVGGILIFILTHQIVSKFLQIPLEIIPMAVSVFYISALGFFINMVLTVFNAIPSALQRMDITNTRNVAVGLLNSLGTILLLFLGFGLIEIIALNIAVSLLVTAVLYFDIKKILPNLSLKLRFEREIFLKLLKFSGYKFIGNTGGQIVFQLDKLILGFFHPISYVTFYTVPVTLVQKAFSLMLNITNAVFPALSHSFTSGNRERSKDLYLRMGKFIVFIMTPLMAILFIFADLILVLWLNGEFALRSYQTLRILSVAYFIAALSAPGVIASDASGNPRLPAIFSSISAVINVVAAFILIPRFGIEGAAYALLINFIAQVPIFMFIVNKSLMKISNLEFISKSILKPLTSGVLAGLITSFFNNLIPVSWGKLILGVIVFSSSYLIINFLIGTFDQKDKTTFRFLISKIRRNNNE